jgi:hypothetical protein
MSKPEAPAYCLVELHGDLVLPAHIAVQVFPLLCQGEPVTYNWSDKTYKRNTDQRAPTLKVFTVAQYAELALNSED